MGMGPDFLDLFCSWVSSKFLTRGGSILDIGTSELFCSNDPSSLDRFCKFYAVESFPEGERNLLANRQFASNLLRRVGYKYASIDYADYAGIIRLDLNFQSLPEEHQGKYDIVLNCGTSEHIMNQLNVFKTMHDACSVGGVMYHGVPAWGEYEHGIINYNPKWFWALALANDYQILKFYGNADSEQYSLRDDFMKQIEFNLRPIGNRTWLSILLKKTKSAPFQVLNDPAFSATATTP